MEEFEFNVELVYVLKGPRQVGKTTMLKTIIGKLLGEGGFHRNIFYFSCNLIETYQELAEVLDLYLKSTDSSKIISSPAVFLCPSML